MYKKNHFYKKAAISAASVGLVVSAVSPLAYAANNFTDVSSRYTEAVDYLVDEKITIGITSSQFGTQLPIKRVDAAIMLAKALKLNTSNVPPSGFTDVPTRGEPFVAALKAKGIVNGKTATQYASQQNVTRGEIALMLAKAYSIGTSTEDNVPFTDVPDRYFAAVSALLESGITTGKDGSSFGTDDPITRGEFAIFLFRISKFPPADASIDKSDLQELIDLLDMYDEDYYTPQSWAALELELESAVTVATDTDATQAEIDAAYNDLLDAVDALVLAEILYTADAGADENGVTLTFTKSIGEDGAIDPVDGTIADADLTLDGSGATLTLESDAGADIGETAEFNTNLGGTDVTVEVTWNGTKWVVDSTPADVFVDATGDNSGDIDSLIDLDILNGGLLDGSISLDDLLSSDTLIRLSLLPGSGLAAGDVISIGSGELNLLTVTLTEEDIARGTVDVELTSNLLSQLTGGEVLDLQGIVNQDGEITGGLLGTIELPEFPLVDPVIDLAESTVSDLLYILSGEQPLLVSLEGDGLEQVEAGNTLELKVNGEEEVVFTKVITQADIDRGFVEYTFVDENLVQRLLNGLTEGDTITITPALTDGTQTSTGATVNITVTAGLLSGITDLLDELLGGGLLGDGLLDGLLNGGGSGGVLDDLLGGIL